MEVVDGHAIVLMLTIFLRNSCVCGTPLDAYNFTVTNNYPLGEGKWTAVITGGKFSFPGQIVAAGSAYVFVRFSVPIINYKDYLAGTGVAKQDTNSKWLISNVGYQANDELMFTFEFNYNVWLGKTFPVGDCALFTSLAEAQYQAESNPEYPQSTPADPHLANAVPRSITISYKAPQTHTLTGSCDYSFMGYKFGEREAYSFISFGSSIYLSTYYDYQGSDVVQSDPVAGYVIARMLYGGENLSHMSFGVETFAVPGASDIKCDLYIGLTAAASAASARFPTMSSTVAAPTTSVAAPATSVAAPTCTPTPAYTLSVSRRKAMHEVEEARDKIVQGAFIWNSTTFSLLSCFRQCLGDVDCFAFGWQPMKKQCTGFRNIIACISPASPMKSQLYMLKDE